MRKFKMLLQYLFLLITFQILFSIEICLAKPLTTEVLQYFEADKITFANYKDEYKVLACKLLTYSRMKNLYEEEVIDRFLNQTDDKAGYLDLLQEKIKEKCMSTLDNNMEIFDLNLYVNWDKTKEQFVDVNLTSLLRNYTNMQNEDEKSVKGEL